MHPRDHEYESTTCNLGNAYFVRVLNTTHPIHTLRRMNILSRVSPRVECSPSKCPAKALISFQEHVKAPRVVVLNKKHQQHFFVMVAYIPNGWYHRKNDKKKWGISKNKEPAPLFFCFRYALQIC